MREGFPWDQRQLRAVFWFWLASAPALLLMEHRLEALGFYAAMPVVSGVVIFLARIGYLWVWKSITGARS